MRSDMKKVIITPGRHGGGGKFPRPRIEVDDDYEFVEPRKNAKLPSKNMKRPHIAYHNGKEQTDHLGPIRRFLEKHVGRNWDDVWSEICEYASERDVIGRHLRAHVEMFVETTTRMKDGEVVGHNDLSFWVHEFYVHPETHILCKGEGRRRWRSSYHVPQVAELDGQEYYCHEGIWYRVHYRAVEDSPRADDRLWGFRIDVFDNVSHGDPKLIWGWNDWGQKRNLREAYGLDKDGKVRYCYWKQQANSKEIRKIKKAQDV